MKLLTTFLFVILLALWMGFPSTTGSDLPAGKQSPEKPGECLPDPCICNTPTVYKCWGDNDCEGRKKCCRYCCTMECRDPRLPG
ncbi:PREDICTED: omwaprin-a-like [Thamnophis sirtalis]|uniref:Omwaprin-a-like n=1 Tax=Thamnophis sirtalis TaxID=35019 RepID=A0A6I9XJF8_9SAUR|nr:PREDICTED: omwaprin-a-like [Thamnophis sirtalis]